MNFKDSVNMYLLEDRQEIIEESIKNNSMSNRLSKIIEKANKKAESFAANGRSASAKAIRNTLPDLEMAKKEFLALENKYASASESEKKALKEKYNSLKKKYSDKLRKFNGKGMVTAAIAATALAALSGSPISDFKQDVGMDYHRRLSASASETQRGKDELKKMFPTDDEEVLDNNTLYTYMYKKYKNGSGKELEKDMYKNVVSKKRQLADAQARYRLEQSKENYKNLSRAIRSFYDFRYIDTNMTDEFLELKKKGIKSDNFIGAKLYSMIPDRYRESSSVVTENYFPY